jgi:hypothetical protein
MMDMTFTCPKCGGHTFGSSFVGPSDGPMERMCHGIVKSKSCAFKFRQQDDWKYFRIVKVRAFKNRDEHELIMEIIRSTPAYGTGFPGK